MAILDNSLLRDLFQNNLDYVSKQIGRILDALYGEQATEDSIIPNDAFAFSTDMYIGCRSTDVKTDLRGGRYMCAVYHVNVDNITGFTITGLRGTPVAYDYNTSQAEIDYLTDNVMPYLASYELHNTMEDLNIDHFAVQYDSLRMYKNGSITSFSVHNPFGIDTNKNVNYTDITFGGKQVMSNVVDVYGASTFIDPSNLEQEWTGTYNLKLCSIGDEQNPSSFILYPSSDSHHVDNNIDNSTTNIINYNGDDIYNYYNDDGDIIINGGSGSLVPVVGLNYNDFKFILDGLIDELNLHFNFGGDGVTEPLDYAPTWEELHYIDQGSFYITPVKQIPALPDAPNVADTFVDVSDYVALLGGSVTKLTSIFGSIGLDMMLVLTFLSCLVIRHLRR